MTAKAWCMKVRVTYRCGCSETGKTYHKCNSTASNCKLWTISRPYDKNCNECREENVDRRKPSDSGKADSSWNNTNNTELGRQLYVQPMEIMQLPSDFTESAKKVTTS
jgi:hypothetical protein